MKKSGQVNDDYLSYLSSSEFIEIINVRNPFSRLHSGWGDKMKEYKSKDGKLTHQGNLYKNLYDQIANEANKFDGQAPPPGYKVSLESFANYVANKQELNGHFASQTQHCQQVRYLIVVNIDILNGE